MHDLAVASGRLGIAPLPGAAGPYATDLARLTDWAPAAVLSLTTQDEMRAARAAGLGDDLSARNIQWLHAPLPDFSEPRSDEHTVTCETLLGFLQQGARVLLHCRGGCGRSGMMALRIMIDAGEPAEKALARLRATRPCAVETDAQMVWATGGAIARAAP